MIMKKLESQIEMVVGKTDTGFKAFLIQNHSFCV